MFSLVSNRYERASMIVTSNKPFSAWGEIFGDDMAATAMIDRLIHHSEILSLKGDSYRLRGKDLDTRIGCQTRRNRMTAPSRPSPRAAERLTTRRSERDPSRREATIAAQASPYGLGLRDDGRSAPPPASTQPSSGLVFDRREWPSFRPALTHIAHPWYGSFARGWSQECGGGGLEGSRMR